MEEEKQLDQDAAATASTPGDYDSDAVTDADRATESADTVPIMDGVDPIVAEAAAAAAAAAAAQQDAQTPIDTIEMLKATAETAQAQLEDFKAQYTRLAADFENFRKRTQKEKSDLEEQVKCKTIKDLLPVIDNFERARSQIQPKTDGEMEIHKSYQSVYKQLVDGLKRLGVAPMRPEGEAFDPNLHDAVMREQTDEYPDGTVIEELMRGYLLGERVLRHAMVKVATAPDPVLSSDEGAIEENT